MPGAHLDLKLMQCYPDVGGADAWLGGNWTPAGSQWWTGWHLPGPLDTIRPAGPPGTIQWSWPNPHWVLIGFERWEYFRRFPHSRLMEARYQDPNPSTLAVAPEPEGHWHVTYGRNGLEQSCRWVPNPLEEPGHLYLKGDTGKGKGKGGTKGKGPGDKGKGKGKGGAKGEGNNQGKST